MPTQYIAPGKTLANGADIVLADGAATTLSVYGVTDSRAVVEIQLRDPVGNYQVIGKLPDKGVYAVQVMGPCTIRAVRKASSHDSGVSRD